MSTVTIPDTAVVDVGDVVKVRGEKYTVTSIESLTEIEVEKMPIAMVNKDKDVVCIQCHDGHGSPPDHIEQHRALPAGVRCIDCGKIYVRSETEMGWRQPTAIELMKESIDAQNQIR
jgi:uncharacterized Zn finger protein